MAKKPKPTKPPKKGGGTVYRSAKSGRYVSKKDAQRHPDTTVKESGSGKKDAKRHPKTTGKESRSGKRK